MVVKIRMTSLKDNLATSYENFKHSYFLIRNCTASNSAKIWRRITVTNFSNFTTALSILCIYPLYNNPYKVNSYWPVLQTIRQRKDDNK